MTTLREAAQQALDVLDKLNKDGWILADFEDEVCASIEALHAALAQPEQEPVAVWELQEGGWDTIADAEWMESLPIGTKLYTAPPQREWQTLTDNEIEQVKKETFEQFHFAVMTNGSAVRNINDVWQNLEAKLKEKNRG